jgi:hypothetical protein
MSKRIEEGVRHLAARLEGALYVTKPKHHAIIKNVGLSEESIALVSEEVGFRGLSETVRFEGETDDGLRDRIKATVEGRNQFPGLSQIAEREAQQEEQARKDAEVKAFEDELLKL